MSLPSVMRNECRCAAGKEVETRLRIGVLALQGAVIEHVRAVQNCGAEAITIKRKADLERVDGLIIPGGESTTIGKLMLKYDLLPAARDLIREGLPVFGTCAGLILLAERIEGSDQPTLGVMDITVRRNAFGRQRESFEADLDIPVLGQPAFRSVFIRAPYILETGPRAEALAWFNGKTIMARQDRLLAAAFHPELTDDLRLHRYFLSMVGDPAPIQPERQSS